MAEQKKGVRFGPRMSKSKKHRMKSRLAAAAAVLLVVVALAAAGIQYNKFVAQSIYEESTSHLAEVLHQCNKMLNEMVSKNVTYLHMWSGSLQHLSDEQEICEFMEAAQQEIGFTEFYFLSPEGNYMTVTGETGYLGLQGNLEENISQGNDMIMSAVLPGKPQMLVFACPEMQGSYHGFAYDAIAVAYNNEAIVKVLDISAFQDSAIRYVVHSDGRIVINGKANPEYVIYNIFAVLQEYSDLTKAQLRALARDFEQGNSGSVRVTLDGVRYYLTYESVNVQDWTLVGLVPADIVNAGMNTLQSRTALIVAVFTLCLAVLAILLILQKSHTKLRRKNTELLYREELFAKLSLNVDDVFMMLDAKSARVDYVSPNIERLLGLPEQAVRQDIEVLKNLHPKDAPDRDKDFLAGLTSGQQREWEFDFNHQQTGERRWFHIIAMGSEVEGRRKYILVMSDRTADKKVNQALSEAVRAAETANRAKSTFLSNMSHDIRTPMNAIIGFTNIALHQDSVPEMHNCLKKIEESSDHLLSLLNDVLDISRIESGKVEFSPVPANITAVTDSVIEIVKGMLLNRELNFEVHREPLQNPYVMTEPVRIREILVNILNNAVKFTKDGGTIRFDAGSRPGADAQHIVICYRIKDTGIGMSEEFQKKLFDEFAQEENGVRTQYKGTGLGMPISKKYVELMGGTITVDSRKGVGTTFTVEIPMELTNAEKVEKTKPLVQHNDLKGIKVLLAEDNDLNAELATILLEDLGMTVTRAADGQEVVDLFAEHPAGTYDIILMDIMMPEMDGHQAAKAIRAMYADRSDAEEIPIIALSANAFSEDVQASLDAGMNGHVSKPLNMEEVTKVIELNLNRP